MRRESFATRTSRSAVSFLSLFAILPAITASCGGQVASTHRASESDGGASGAAGSSYDGGNAGSGSSGGAFSGSAGANGANGNSGSNGVGGVAGAGGVAGEAGASGGNGAAGTEGPGASSGAAGESGSSGSNGTSGTAGTGEVGACQDPTPLPLGVLHDSTLGAASEFSPIVQYPCSFVPGPGRERVYVYTSDVDGTLSVRVTFNATSNDHTFVYTRESCSDASSQTTCAQGQFPMLQRGAYAGAPIYLIVDTSDSSTDGSGYMLESAFTPSVCGNLAVEAPEDCDDGNDTSGDGCTNCRYEPEHECHDLKDNDFDGLVDCQDPECQASGQCTPGTGAVGSPCTQSSECASGVGAAGFEPHCFSELGMGYPGGMCSELCDVNENDCPAGTTCRSYPKDVQFSSETGLCRPDCTVDGDCREGYVCNSGCVPRCTTDAPCVATQHCATEVTTLLPNRCVTAEKCSDGVDNDRDGFIDCADFQDDVSCVTTPACSDLLVEACGAAIALGEGVFHGTTVGGSNLMQPIALNCSWLFPKGIGREKIYQYTAPTAGQLMISFSTSQRLLFYVRDTCENPASETDCMLATQTSSGPAGYGDVFTAGQTRWIIIDSTSPEEEGEFALDLAFVPM